MNPEKILRQIVQGKKVIRFSDFIRLIQAFGFTLDRVSGSHHIFKREGIEEMV
ncbi:MAG: type II toxin-antitoxin system HicA family toxin, partial [Sediminispirochaetaceae bacterium]